MLVLVIVLHSKFDFQTAEVIGRVFLIICVFLSILLIFGISNQSRLSKEKAEIEQLLRKEENLHRLSKENIDLINMKCHDLKHSISAVRQSGSLPVSEEELYDVESAIAVYDSFIDTGNSDLDIVITEKSLYCKNTTFSSAALSTVKNWNFCRRATYIRCSATLLTTP